MKLYLLNLGRCDLDKGKILTPGSEQGRWIRIPIVAFLIETDDGHRILVDTGMHREHINDPEATFRGRRISKYLSPRMAEADDIRHRLAEIGLQTADIDIVISTHFHFDHAGNHAEFGDARIVAQRACHHHAKANPMPCPPESWDLPHLTYVLIDGDQELAAGVSLVETAGHVPGHMSVVVRLPRTGTVVLAIDAICLRENLERDNWAAQLDPEQARLSARKLAEIARREHGLLIPGHDPAAWAELKHAPEYYE